jgi:hypothetical protein
MARQTARGRTRASAVSRKRRTQKRVMKAAGSRAKSRSPRSVRRTSPKKGATPARAVVRKALSGTMPSVPVASPSRDERDEVLEAARERDEQDGEDKDEGGRAEITGGM